MIILDVIIIDFFWGQVIMHVNWQKGIEIVDPCMIQTSSWQTNPFHCQRMVSFVCVFIFWTGVYFLDSERICSMHIVPGESHLGYNLDHPLLSAPRNRR